MTGAKEKIMRERRAVLDQFKAGLSGAVEALRIAIDRARSDNKDFAAAAREFLEVCQSAINPNVGADDIREMLIQHILTADIFREIFGDERPRSENKIAAKLDALADIFPVRGFRRDASDKMRAAVDLSGRREREKFLQSVCEEFYRACGPKSADRLGVVYTPSEVANFMVRAADQLVRKHFARRLWDDHVQILDPAAGTGTFVTELIDFFPVGNLRRKYAEELRANEVAILPYYIANLNIERAYKAKTGEYHEFPGIRFADTLDNPAFQSGGKSQPTLGGLAAENMERIRRQNKREISVVIGNPPWNANQMNENENNKNREYPGVDARVKATYIAESAAQKTKLYDMYTRFIRWASDRIGKDGIVAFVTNSSFIDAKGFDGFRKTVAREFNELHILDLRGNSRVSRDEAIRQGGNIFNVRVGVAVWFFVRNANLPGCQIWHYAVADNMPAAEKLALLFPDKTLDDFAFRSVVPDARGDWVGRVDNDFGELIPMAERRAKLEKTGNGEKAVFKLYSLGINTARDEWVYDWTPQDLSRKVRFFIEEYEAKRAVFGGTESVDPKELGTVIKWSRDLKKQLADNSKNRFQAARVRRVMYRPFTVKMLYISQPLNEMLSQVPQIFPDKAENIGLCFCVNGSDFYVLAADMPWDLHFVGDSQCVPLYRHCGDGKRRSNITKWGLSQFREHYGDAKIRARDVFHYAYAVLHNPAYREKYARNLRRDFPRLPFYPDFRKWARRGAKLMALHLGFESAKPFPLVRRDSDGDSGRVKLRADKKNGRIVVDDKTTLEGVPSEAWEYKLGGRSALEWVLDQHKEKRVKDTTVAAKFPPEPFSRRKESVMELLRRVCAVSVETMKIIREMEGRERES